MSSSTFLTHLLLYFVDVVTPKIDTDNMAQASTKDLHLQKRQVVFKAGMATNKSPPSPLTSPQVKKFTQAYRDSVNILIHVETVFPFDLFPDILIVDPLKVNYTHNIFFYSSFTESIPIADITNVVVEESVIFATLRISFISYPTRQIYIKPLWKHQAEKTREIIAGLMIANREKIEMKQLPFKNSAAIGQLGQMDQGLL